MPSQPLIRISPPEEPKPQKARIPVDFAQRWRSSYEEQGDPPVVSVFITQAAFSRVCLHTTSEPDYEVGGVLVGKWYQDVDRDEMQFIVVETVLPARYTRHGSVYLTFTQDSLVDLHTKIDESFRGRQIVGWYHTHPRMGVFLSHYDIWLHDNFFGEAWQVALVIEPRSATGGFFIRQANGELDAHRYFGFHELNGNYRRSVVTWQNLHRVKKKLRKRSNHE